jgi:EAL domain-containing protein (putative c-di-GMP-specific phosphodiesterase class I)
MQTVEPALEKLRDLHTLGVKVAIDNFGTGFSSLPSLRQFMVSRLKIDQSFVHDLPGDSDAETVVVAIVAVGRSLGPRILAEGVETQAQAEFLKSISCNEAQGHLFAAPMTCTELEAWMTERQCT